MLVYTEETLDVWDFIMTGTFDLTIHKHKRTKQDGIKMLCHIQFPAYTSNDTTIQQLSLYMYNLVFDILQDQLP